ncbi:hypothetical protein EXIGLDRAFT_476230 [Exidia glandulosa HHB12029]|uniref:Uncharacterized protein n=1 Tax=Exidia glandulosa HHB12029 TaxID=1314781 RepID=A0A166NKD7_EXIGL|nr:hypothetical protein EXIGLDRAFT_476230 [Exidia glandulosa HHB12029]
MRCCSILHAPRRRRTSDSPPLYTPSKRSTLMLLLDAATARRRRQQRSGLHIQNDARIRGRLGRQAALVVVQAYGHLDCHFYTNDAATTTTAANSTIATGKNNNVNDRYQGRHRQLQ